MGRSLRKVAPGSLVEITCRVVQSRLLLRPSSMLNLLVAGVIARAQQRYSVQVCFVVVLGNHIHLLLVPTDVEALADFMEYVSSNISREVGRLVDWTGPLWSRRYVSIPCSAEPEVQLDRLRYMLSQGPKENLVWSPLEWPGVHSEALRSARHFTGGGLVRLAARTRASCTAAERERLILGPYAGTSGTGSR